MNELKLGYAWVNINPSLKCGVYGYCFHHFAKELLAEL